MPNTMSLYCFELRPGDLIVASRWLFDNEEDFQTWGLDLIVAVNQHDQVNVQLLTANGTIHQVIYPENILFDVLRLT